MENASEIYVLPDENDSMVVQDLIRWKILTCQCLTWNEECLGLDTHVHNIHIVFIYMSHVIVALVQQQLFGQSLPSAHCLIGHDGAL